MHEPPGDRDPRDTRIEELLERVERGDITDAEREELALYKDDDPALDARIAAREDARQVGGEWLVRVRADEKLQAAESSPAVRAERGLGVGLLIGGFVLTPFSPLFSVVGLLGGMTLLSWSFLRVRIRTRKDDPYKDIDK